MAPVTTSLNFRFVDGTTGTLRIGQSIQREAAPPMYSAMEGWFLCEYPSRQDAFLIVLSSGILRDVHKRAVLTHGRPFWVRSSKPNAVVLFDKQLMLLGSGGVVRLYIKGTVFEDLIYGRKN